MISDSHHHMLSRQRIADVGESAAAAGATTAGREGHLGFAESSGLRYPDRGGARGAGARVFDYLLWSGRID
jgi:hypothetical protein